MAVTDICEAHTDRSLTEQQVLQHLHDRPQDWSLNKRNEQKIEFMYEKYQIPCDAVLSRIALIARNDIHWNYPLAGFFDRHNKCIDISVPLEQLSIRLYDIGRIF